jgi:poly(A) polymerase
MTARRLLAQVPILREALRAAGRRRLYLVGGAVRDAVLGRETADYDFMVAEAPAVAARLARLLGGTIVRLHEEWPTARVVVRAPRRLDLDFASPRAPTLSGDLWARDFTINAIAAGPIGPHPRLLDPCGGRVDCCRHVIRMTSAAALEADPVRVVRAYRLMSDLAFQLDGRTQRTCRRLAHLVPLSPPERVGAEFAKLCAGQAPAGALRAMAASEVLQAVIPELAPAVGLSQGGAHEFDVFSHSLLAVERLAALVECPGEPFPDHVPLVRDYADDPETRLVLVLATLLHDIAKPECRVWAGGRFRFFGHEHRGAQIAERIARRLRIRRRLRRRLHHLIGSHMRLLQPMMGARLSERALRRLVRDTVPDTVGLVLLCLADRRALRSHVDPREEASAVAGLASVLDLVSQSGRAPRTLAPVLTGDDLIALGLTPGPIFGEVLAALDEAWAAGEVTDKEDALEWVKGRWPVAVRIRDRGGR